MEKYLSIRVQTALYISIFFISLHHVFVYLTNSSVFKYTFGLKTLDILAIYGVAAFLGIFIYLYLIKKGIGNNIKKNIYIATFIELICLLLMYYFSTNQYAYSTYIFMGLFVIHNSLTPYIMFNLDSLFESYTNIKDRGHGRGIYLTVWNIPFVIVPLIMSSLSVSNLPITYMVSSVLLFPFLYIIFNNIKNPSQTIKSIEDKSEKLYIKIQSFFKDKLDRNAFITQSSLHLYYGFSVVVLPIYLHSVFMFDWDKIGLIFTAMTAPFVLIQIPFGNIEDKRHNEKKIFRLGLIITIFFTILIALIKPEMTASMSFLLFCAFLFLSRVGCALIEISTESMFYKHVTERDDTALLMFRVARVFPYSLGILFLLFI